MQRKHLEFAASRGNKAAIAALEGPECPDSLRYLLALARALHGRSGVGMNGLAPLTYTTIYHYSRLMRMTLDTEDVEAVILIDGILLFPGDPEKESE